MPHKSARESDKRFFVRKRCKTAGILCVLQGFTNAFLTEKIRQNSLAHLCGVALEILRAGRSPDFLPRCRTLPGFPVYLCGAPVHSDGIAPDSHRIPFSPIPAERTLRNGHLTRYKCMFSYSIPAEIIAFRENDVNCSRPSGFRLSPCAALPPYAAGSLSGSPTNIISAGSLHCMTINETTNRLPDSFWNHTALQSAMQVIYKETEVYNSLFFSQSSCRNYRKCL